MRLLDDTESVLSYGSPGDFGDPYIQRQMSPGTYFLKVYAKESLAISGPYYLSVAMY